jgi:hypothetical protein
MKRHKKYQAVCPNCGPRIARNTESYAIDEANEHMNREHGNIPWGFTMTVVYMPLESTKDAGK